MLFHLIIRLIIARSLSLISIILSKSLHGCFINNKSPMHSDIPNDACISLFIVKGNSDFKTVYVCSSCNLGKVGKCTIVCQSMARSARLLPLYPLNWPPFIHQLVTRLLSKIMQFMLGTGIILADFGNKWTFI